MGQRRRARGPRRPGLVVEIRGGDFGRCRQSQRTQPGGSLLVDLDPIEVTCIGTQPPSQPGIRSTPRVAPSANSVVIAAILARRGMQLRAVRRDTTPVVERARLVQPLQQGPVVRVDQRPVHPGRG